MLSNFNGVARFSDASNIVLTTDMCSGWVVRERHNAEGKPISLDYGCYLSEDVFVSVPIHFSLKDKLIPLAPKGEYMYYALPKVIQLAVSKYTNKKGKECPILVEANEKHPAVFIASLTVDCTNESIINMTVSEGVKVVRKYIDKNRKSVAVIAFYEDASVINPSFKVVVTKGVIGGKTLETCTYNFDVQTNVTTVTESHTTEQPVKTEFINLPAFIETPKVNANKKNHAKESANVQQETAE